MNIKFSIITVCFNSEKTIKETIKSVESQTYANYEHIFIDGKSNDKTLEIISEYMKSSDKVRLISEKDTGVYNAMNKGIKLAEGDLVLFLNSDDTIEDNALELIANNYSNDIDLIYGDLYWFEEYKGNIYEKLFKVDYENVVKNKGLIPHNSTFVKTSIIKENLFDENLKIAADYKFFLNMYKQNRTIKYIPYIITNMRVGGISSTQPELAIEEHEKCQKEVFEYTDINVEEAKKVMRKITFIKNISKYLLPSNFYIKLRYVNKGWKLKNSNLV